MTQETSKETAPAFTITKTEKLPRSTVVVEAEINEETLKKHRDIAIKHLSEHMDIPGFRKGHIPESVVVSKIGEMGILEEAAEEILHKIIPSILAKEKLFPLINPKVEITSLAIGNPLKFKMTVATMPEFEMPDYKTIAGKIVSKKAVEQSVTGKEVTEAMEQIRKMVFTGKAQAEGKKELPEITDETVKQVGNFKDVKELEERVRTDLKKDKENKIKEQRRLEMIDELVKASKIEVPEVLVKNETEKMEHQFRADIERMGLKFDDYLAKAKKKIEDLRKEWEPMAEKRVSYDILAGRIASMEKILPTGEEVEHESSHIMEHHKDANPDAVKNYVEHTLIHQKVFEFLENLKEGKGL